MKHIKKFETLLKYSDERVINHIFKPFADNIKNILLSLKNIDNIPGTNVKIYYDDSKDIKIIYGYKYNNLFNVRLITYDRTDYLELTILLYYRDDRNSNNKELYNIFDKVLEKYEEERSFYYRQCHDIKIEDTNNLSVLNNIYNDVKNEFEIYINSKKYNL